MKPVNSMSVSTAVAVIIVIVAGRLLADQPRLRDTLQGRDKLISSIAFSPDGKTLASISLSISRIWGLTSGKSAVIKSRLLSNAPFSADGQTLLLSGASSYPRQLYDLKSGKTTAWRDICNSHLNSILNHNLRLR
jgi:WD40 repeat protein